MHVESRNDFIFLFLDRGPHDQWDIFSNSRRLVIYACNKRSCRSLPISLSYLQSLVIFSSAFFLTQEIQVFNFKNTGDLINFYQIFTYELFSKIHWRNQKFSNKMIRLNYTKSLHLRWREYEKYHMRYCNFDINY